MARMRSGWSIASAASGPFTAPRSCTALRSFTGCVETISELVEPAHSRFTPAIGRCHNGVRVGIIFLYALPLVLVCAGCAAKQTRVETHAERPTVEAECVDAEAMHYKPVAWSWPVLGDAERCEPRAADFGLTDAMLPPDGSQVLDEKPTKGRFPTGIAVACVEVRSGKEDASRRLVLVRLADERASWWNQILDGVSPVREVTFSDARGASPDPTPLMEIVRAAARINCGYCLIYARWGDPIHEERMIGALYDTDGGRPVAAFSTSASVPPIEYACALKQKPQDERLARAEFRTARAFERQVYRVVAGLAQRDVQPGTTQPSPWQTDRPLYPRDPRRRYGDPLWP